MPLRNIMKTTSIIAAVRDEADLEAALKSPVRMVFLLSGDLLSLGVQTRRLHEAEKQIFLHFDLVSGLKGDISGIRYAADNFHLNGIISTKPACLKMARDEKLMAVLRIFVIDSSGFKTGLQHAQLCQPDLVEVLPGVSGKIIRMATEHFSQPVIAGGLIQDDEDVAQALDAGAAAVSTSCHRLWR